MKTQTIMKSTLLLIALFSITFSFQSKGQNKLDKLFAETTPEQRAGLLTQKMTEKLVLTDDQRSLIYDVNLTYARKVESAYTSSGTKLKRVKNMKAVSKEKDGELKKIMTEDQYKSYLKYKEELKEMIKEKVEERHF